MHGTIDDVIVMRDVMVPMRDGVRLATDMTIPARAGKPLPGPFPTLLHRTPYDKSAARLSEVSVRNPVPKANIEIARDLSKAGYVVLNQDCRGRYQSEGVFEKYIGEGPDGFDTLQWARAQPWCDGRFGTFGLSYSAHVQTALAVQQPEGLRAMFLDSGGFWNAYQGGVRRGGAFEMKQVTWAFKHACLSDAARDPSVAAALAAEDIADWILRKQWQRGASPMRHVPEYEDYLFDQWEHAAFDDFWQTPELYAAAHYATLARYPTFLISGWFDPYAETMFEHLKGITEAGGHAELVMGPWLHGRRSQTFAGDVDFGPHSVLDDQIAPDYDALRRNWFDRWLKADGAATDNAPVRWFCMGGGSGRRNAEGRLDHGGQWRADRAWPAPEAVPTPLYLTADGGLQLTPAPDGTRSFVSDPDNPVPTIGGAVTSGAPVMEGGAFDQVENAAVFGARPPFIALAQRPDVLVFATAPLTRDIEIAGPVEVALTLTLDAPDADITVKLVDWAPPGDDTPEGFAMNLTDGILRLRFRNSWTDPEPVPPGMPVNCTVAATPVANLFRKGHRIRLDISGANFPKFDINPQTGASAIETSERRVATPVLHLGSTRAQLTLSVLP